MILKSRYDLLSNYGVQRLMARSSIVESYNFNFFYSGPSNIPSIDMTHQVAGEDSSTDTPGIGDPRTHQDVRRSVKVRDIIA